MPKSRYYFPLPFSPNQTVTLEGEEVRHLKVMRARVGESVELVNGKGQLARGRLTKMGRTADIEIEEVEQEEERCPRLILAQALPRVNRLDLILEKGTELMASAFWLFPGERSEKRALTKTQLERAERVSIAAMKQCGSLTLPEIRVMPPLKEWKEWPTCALFGDIRQGAPLLKDVLPEGEEVVFFVGPEAGLTEGEIGDLERRGVQGVNLHRHVLRTDTAPLVALSLLSHLILI